MNKELDLDPGSGEASDLNSDQKDGLLGEECPKQKGQPVQRPSWPEGK